MSRKAQDKANKAFSASQKRNERLLEERKSARTARLDKTERLRALRLARDAAEKDAES